MAYTNMGSILVLLNVSGSLYLVSKVFWNAILARQAYWELLRSNKANTKNAKVVQENQNTGEKNHERKDAATESKSSDAGKTKNKRGLEVERTMPLNKQSIYTHVKGTVTGTVPGSETDTVLGSDTGTIQKTETKTEIVTQMETETKTETGTKSETEIGTEMVREPRTQTGIETGTAATKTETRTETSTLTITDPKTESGTVIKTVTTTISDSNTSNSTSNDDDEWEDLEEEEEVGDVEDVKVTAENVLVEGNVEVCSTFAQTTFTHNTTATIAKPAVQVSTTTTSDAPLSGETLAEQSEQLLPFEVRDLTVSETGNVTVTKTVDENVEVEEDEEACLSFAKTTFAPNTAATTTFDDALSGVTSDEETVLLSPLISEVKDLTVNETVTVTITADVGDKDIVEEEEEACNSIAKTTFTTNTAATTTFDDALSGVTSDKKTESLLPLPYEVRDLTVNETFNVTIAEDDEVVGEKDIVEDEEEVCTSIAKTTFTSNTAATTTSDDALSGVTLDEETVALSPLPFEIRDLTVNETFNVTIAKYEETVGEKDIMDEDEEAFTHNTAAATKPGVRTSSTTCDTVLSVETSDEVTEPLFPLPFEIGDLTVTGSVILVVPVATQLAVGGSQGDMGSSSATSIGSYEYADSY